MKSEAELRQELEDAKLTAALYDQLGAEGKRLAALQRQLDERDIRPLPKLPYSGNKRHRKRLRFLLIAAALLALLLLGGAASALFEYYFGYFFGQMGGDATFRNSKGQDSRNFDWTGYYRLPTPEGFSLNSVKQDGGTIIAIYSNGKRAFTFSQIDGYIGGFQDEEYSEGMTAGAVGGQGALLFSDATESRVCWGDNPHFIIEGTIPLADALEYAATVSYVPADDENKK